MGRSTSALVGALLLACLLPASARARDTEHLLPLADTVESDHGRSYLLDIPLYLRGEAHPEVAKELAQVDTSRSTHGVFRSDESSCRVAALSALRVLQEEAQRRGGDAVVDIVSTTRKKMSESATDYRCVAGAFIVHVGLRGRVVQLGAQPEPAAEPESASASAR